MLAATVTHKLADLHLGSVSRKWRTMLLHEMSWQRGVITLLLLVMTTVASYWNHTFDQPLTGPLVFLLGVSLIGATQGLFFGLVSAIVGAAIVNYLIERPAFILNFDSIRDYAPLTAMSIAAAISGTLANRVRDKAQQAAARARELAILLEATRRLESALHPEEVAAAVDAFAPANLGLQALVFIDKNGRAEQIAGPETSPAEAALAQDCITGRKASRPPGPWTARSLISRSGAIGAILFHRLGGRHLVSDATVDAFFNIVAIALERCFLLNRLANAQAIERSEAFKTAILSSISHDIRTPLAAISTSASGLLAYDAELSAASKTQLLGTIKEQCGRLSRYTEKLLNFGRLQAGIDIAKLPAVDLVDVVGGAINGIRPFLGKRRIRKSLGPAPIFVRADPVLMEQVFFNVLDNAVLYSPDGSAIELAVALNGTSVSATITDEGVGIPRSDLEKVFDRFYRVSRAGPSGSGLGLAIAKGFVRMVGGDVRAESPVAHGSGTRMIITLPLAEPG